ncbi:MAG TPA: bifunctional phosphoribosyl-AMP cyclohydrolase/phosphoribosyl-ATP diphosphatase HisIE [Kofleriaceae bacterium]|nr:bifunctional phosphoribosyl-AMP cyclohydrolase/phosphoribosyl-ATP diphosphatase HisIE [Kofleriaceae bacterium]
MIERAENLAWDERGLLPAIVEDASDGGVRMLGWMNAEALARTLSTGFVWFYSRSRQRLWKKGESSGNTLAVRGVFADCDSDAILVRAVPAGPTCHTGERSCFFRRLDEGREAAPENTDARVLDRLAEVIAQRKREAAPDKSYTASLLAAGPAKILAKIEEEHGELAAEIPAGPPERIVAETADLLFHVLVGLGSREVELDAVWAELGRRFGVSGHAEKAARSHTEDT